MRLMRIKEKNTTFSIINKSKKLPTLSVYRLFKVTFHSYSSLFFLFLLLVVVVLVLDVLVVENIRAH